MDTPASLHKLTVLAQLLDRLRTHTHLRRKIKLSKPRVRKICATCCSTATPCN